MKKKTLIKVLSVFMFSLMLSSCSSASTGSTQEQLKVKNGTLMEIPQNTDTIKVLADVGSIKVVKGENYRIEGENIVESWLSTKIDGTSLLINYQPPSPEVVKNTDTTSHIIKVTLPDGHNIKNAEFNTGTGTFEGEGLETENLTLSQGSGNMSLNNIQSDSLTIECGSGTTECRNITVKENSLIMAGTGNISIYGDLSGTVNIEGGTGTADISFIQPKENYIISGESALKKITVDGSPLESSQES